MTLRIARRIFDEALAACSIEQAFARALPLDSGGAERVLVVSMGKAAATMARAFEAHSGVPSGKLRTIVAMGGHPRPDERSLAAAGTILDALAQTTPRDLVVFLVSGGASSMVERFLDPAIPLADIPATHRALVESGATIGEINTVRKHLSAVKGGRLARATPAAQRTFFISDVPPDQLEALASGPTLPDPSTVADARRVIALHDLAAAIPRNVLALLDRNDAESLKPGDPAFARSTWQVLLDSDALARAAADAARQAGWHAVIDNSVDDRPTDETADYLLHRLGQERVKNPRVCLINAGEVTVKVPANATGRGGRNQHFALLCAERIAGRDITVLSAGSDGIDGNSTAAGAIVDGTTASRARASGLAPANFLARFDAGGFFAALGDAIVIGPTGNNLRDLRILLA